MRLNTNGWRTGFTHLLASAHVGRSFTVTKVHYQRLDSVASERDATMAALLVHSNASVRV